MDVQGHTTPRFARVREAFSANFSLPEEFSDLGAGLAVYHHGECVVNLIGGFQDPQRSRAWTPNTLTNIWSASKGVLAVAVAQLAARGLLDYETPVAHYWPEFAACGKARITVGEMMSHQAGLNGFAEPTSPDDLYDWDLIIGRLERQAPFWQPGTLTSYHGMTFGWLAGELIRRVSGMELRDFLRQQLAEPLGADLWLGCPLARVSDAAEIIAPPPDRAAVVVNEIAMRTLVNPAPLATVANSGSWRAAQVPAVNVHATADGLARIYGAIANRGHLGRTAILSEAGIELLRTVRSTRPDQLLGPRSWAAGVALNDNGYWGPDPRVFGHSGWGGSFGCASVESSLGMAYVVNRMGSRLNGDPRARSICDAVFQCIEIETAP